MVRLAGSGQGPAPGSRGPATARTHSGPGKEGGPGPSRGTVREKVRESGARPGLALLTWRRRARAGRGPSPRAPVPGAACPGPREAPPHAPPPGPGDPRAGQAETGGRSSRRLRGPGRGSRILPTTVAIGTASCPGIPTRGSERPPGSAATSRPRGLHLQSGRGPGPRVLEGDPCPRATEAPGKRRPADGAAWIPRPTEGRAAPLRGGRARGQFP